MSGEHTFIMVDALEHDYGRKPPSPKIVRGIVRADAIVSIVEYTPLDAPELDGESFLYLELTPDGSMIVRGNLEDLIETLSNL